MNEDNALNQFRILKERHVQMRKPYQSPGTAPVGDRTHDLPHAAASNMVKPLTTRPRRLKWYGHVLRREEYVGKRVMVVEVPGKRRRGRPKRRWMDVIMNDYSERELSGRKRNTEKNGCVT